MAQMEDRGDRYSQTCAPNECGIAGFGHEPKLPVWLHRMPAMCCPEPSEPPAASVATPKRAFAEARQTDLHDRTIAGSEQP